MKRAVTAVMPDGETTQEAMRALLAVGFTGDSVSVIMTAQARERFFPPDGPNAAALGAGIGALLGGLTTIAAGPVTLLAAGPILAVLAGGALGAATGGLLGALVELGLPEEQAKIFAKEIDRGKIVLAVECRTEESASRAEDVLARYSDPDGEVYVAQSA